MSTITSANSVITLTIPRIFNNPVQIQGFSADNVYELEQQQIVQTAMGVDGRLSGGYVHAPVRQTFVLQADSPSVLVFEQWASFQLQATDSYPANGSTDLISTGRRYVSTRGFLTMSSPIPAAGKVLQPRRFVIEWERVTGVPN